MFFIVKETLTAGGGETKARGVGEGLAPKKKKRLEYLDKSAGDERVRRTGGRLSLRGGG